MRRARGRDLRRWVAGVAIAAAPWAAVGQSERFEADETVVAVEIPVQVTSDGAPVRDLTADDFEVLEGRQRREIVDFEEVDLSVTRVVSPHTVSVRTAIPASGRRHFLLLFDMTHSEPKLLSRARDAARRLVLESLHPTDLVGVATWSFTRGSRLVIGFTSDRRQVEAAIGTLGIVDLRDRAADPLGIMVADLNSYSVGLGDTSGSRHHGELDEDFLEAVQDLERAERAQSRQVRSNELTALTQGFSGMAQLMSNLAGRKYVVLLSQGFDSSTVAGTSDFQRQREMEAASEAGEIWKVDSDERFGSTHSAGQLESMLEVFRRADCSIHSVDIGGLSAEGGVENAPRSSDRSAPVKSRVSDRSSLATLAADTGGQLYENFNDLGQAMQKMLASTSVTYVLTIQPQNLKLDGKFHELKVRLKNAPSGAKLAHRPGYYAPRPYATLGESEKQLGTSELLMSGRPGGDIAGGAVAAGFRGDGKRAHVPLIVEVDGPSLLAQRTGDQIRLGVFVYAFDAEGQVRDFVTQSLELDARQVGARLTSESLKFVGDLRLPAGDYSVRTLVRAGERGSYWLGQTDLVVPSFAAGEVAAAGPLFPEAMTSGVVVRSSTSAARTAGLPFPFVNGSEFFLPDGRPVLPSNGEARAWVGVYGFDASAIAVTGELIDSAGRPLRDLQVQVVGRSRNEPAAFEGLELRVRPGNVEPGIYVLHLTLRQGEHRVETSARMSVGS